VLRVVFTPEPSATPLTAQVLVAMAGLELTSLTSESGTQRLAFFNVATLNIPGAREVLAITGTPPDALRSIDCRAASSTASVFS